MISLLPPPRENPFLFGHQTAEATLATAARSGRLHHAWLITGPVGVGKATLAWRFARKLLAGPIPDDSLALPAGDPIFRRVAAGSHADLLAIGREVNPKTGALRGEITVDSVRRVRGFLRLTPAEAGWRVVLVDGADVMNRNAANALLKSLEEPPPRALLLLTCAAPGRLPPTIRSRCRVLDLSSLGDPDMRALLAAALPRQTALEPFIRLAEGIPARALAQAGAAASGVDPTEAAASVLRSAPGKTLAQAVQQGTAIADRVARDTEIFAAFMAALLAGLAHAVRTSARGQSRASACSHPRPCRLGSGMAGPHGPGARH